MHLNLLALAVPFFGLFMLLEYLVARRRKLAVHDPHEAAANISVGIAERTLDLYVVGLFYFVYQWLHEYFALFDLEAGVGLWVLLLLVTDLVWYWYHRAAHEINLFWAVHVVHHQSEDFNYTTSARITVFQAFVRTGFWAVLPVIGFPPEMITTLLLIHGTYPFFTHTQLIGKLGLLEYFLVTPSHHRVHHASNKEYLDKNFGDVFIIWDKLFGTFQKERDDIRIVYGITEPLKSHSFLWQHFHYLAELVVQARRTPGLWRKVKVFFTHPDGVAKDARASAERFFRVSHGKDTRGRPLNRYVVAQLLITMAALFVLVLFEHHFGPVGIVVMPLLILVTLINCGAIMEQKRWVFYLEFARAMLFGWALVAAFPGLGTATCVFLLTVLAIAFFHETRWLYLRLVYAPRVLLHGLRQR